MSYLVDFQNAIHWGKTLRVDLTKSKKLGYLVLLAISAAFGVGILLFLIDPNIKSPVDGVWSAWVTMTHVGYGDVVPSSFIGRLLAAGLILLGLVFFSLFTALVSVSLIGRNIDLMGESVKRIETETGSISRGEDLILDEIAHLQLRLEVLQKLVSSSRDYPSAAKQTIAGS